MTRSHRRPLGFVAAIVAAAAVTAGANVMDGDGSSATVPPASQVPTVVIHGTYAVDFSDPELFAGAVDAVVLGRVLHELPTVPAGGGAPYPRRSFEIDVTQVLHGAMDDRAPLRLLQPGGFDRERGAFVEPEGTTVPRKGPEYLFGLKQDRRGGWVAVAGYGVIDVPAADDARETFVQKWRRAVRERKKPDQG